MMNGQGVSLTSAHPVSDGVPAAGRSQSVNTTLAIDRIVGMIVGVRKRRCVGLSCASPSSYDSEPRALAASDPTPAMVAAWLATRGHSGLTYGPPEVRAQPGALREYSPPKRVDTCASPDEPKVTSGTNIQWGATFCCVPTMPDKSDHLRLRCPFRPLALHSTAPVEETKRFKCVFRPDARRW